jgi:hypothetical protein
MRPHSGFHMIACTVAAVLVMFIVSGCASKPPAIPAAYSGPTLCSDNFGVGRVTCPTTGFVVLDKQKSHGRFPCRVSVARLVPAPADPFADPLPTEWALGSIKDEDATYWTSLFNTFVDVQNVTIMDPLNMERPEANLEKIAAVAGEMKTGLCVIFGPGPADAGTASVLGVIMDTARRERIACVQSLAGPEDSLEPSPDRMIGDQRHEDVNYIAIRRFQLQVRLCMEQLRSRDVPAPATQPSPWRGSVRPFDNQIPPIYIIPNRSLNW